MHVISSIQVPDFFRELARHCDRHSVHLQFCTLDGPGPLHTAMAELGIATHMLGARGRRGYPAAVMQLTRLLRRERIDVVHTHLFDPSAVGLLAGLLAGTPARVMTRWYSDLHVVLRRPLHTWVDGRSARLAHAVIAISQHTRDVLVEVEKVPPERVRVIHPAFEMKTASAPGPRPVTNGPCRLVIVARLHPVKDHRSALLAFRRVLDARSDTRLRIVGAGWLEPELRALAGALRLGDAVDFAGFQADMGRVYDEADVLVHPAIEEAFGFVVVEAMARGIPVVCTPRGIAREIIDDSVNGLLVPLSDPSALAAAMLRLVESPELRTRLGEAGRKSIEGRFSYASVAADYEAVYRTVLRR
jgi:glycosyltransferase involved in cell wall biosynthesis